jgi:hypothetical protein
LLYGMRIAKIGNLDGTSLAVLRGAAVSRAASISTVRNFLSSISRVRESQRAAGLNEKSREQREHILGLGGRPAARIHVGDRSGETPFVARFELIGISPLNPFS